MEQKIRAWKAENRSTQWKESLVEVVLVINFQRHSVINCPPYDLVFRQSVPMRSWFTADE